MSSRVIQVSSAAQLTSVLKTVTGGETILLASGDYGTLTLNGLRPGGMVTIKSADISHEASVRTMAVNHAANFMLSDIAVNHALNAGENENTAAVTVNKSSGITLSHLQIAGSLDGNSFNDGNGIAVTDSDHLTISGSTFQQLHTAVVVARTSDLIFGQNSITAAREGLNMTDVHQALFDRNYVTNMQPNYAAGDHPDDFQVSTGGGAKASSDLTFTNNIMIEGTSGPIGGIFIRSESGALHSNIVIANNYYQGTYRNAIAVSDADAVAINGNTVLDSSKAGNSAAIIVGNVHGATITNDIAPLFMVRTDSVSSGVVMRNDVDVWDPKTKIGIAVAALFSAQNSGNLDLSALNTSVGSIADRAGTGYHSVSGVGASGTQAFAGLNYYQAIHDHLAVQIG